MKAKSDPKIGYMNRIKRIYGTKYTRNWPSFQPKINHIKPVEKKRVVMETEHKIDKNQNNNNAVSNDSTEENCNVKSEHLSTSKQYIDCKWHWNKNCWKSRAWDHHINKWNYQSYIHAKGNIKKFNEFSII